MIAVHKLKKKGLGYTDLTLFGRVLKNVTDKPVLTSADIEAIKYGVYEPDTTLDPVLDATTYDGDIDEVILDTPITGDTRYEEDESGYNFIFTIPARYISKRLLEFHFLLIHTGGSGSGDTPNQQSLIFTGEFVIPRITS